ncbi:hypothetical protein [Nonomuraea cavernae]|uniref:hypothetical protein n=1 Tax=Nonomuraea cavernae TaxID=2045107 RepID=UPI0033F05CE1
MRREPVPPAAEMIPGARDVSFSADDGVRLGAWFVPGDHDVTVLIAGGRRTTCLRRPARPLTRRTGA